MSTKNDIVNITNNVVVKKRGRKSKKELELALKEKELALENKKSSDNNDNISVIIEETNEKNDSTIDETNIHDNTIDDNIINDILTSQLNETINNDIIHDKDMNSEILLKDSLTTDDQKTGIKKRGRKPKGGKIVQQITPLNINKETKPNIILHLKCSLKDLQSNIITDNIETFNFSSNKNDCAYEIISSNDNNLNNSVNNSNNYNSNYNLNNSSNNNKFNNSNNYIDIDDAEMMEYDDNHNDEYSKKTNDIRDVWKKLKALQYNLHINNISDKKSACFWCTYEFDNPPIYIPKYFMKDSYHVYGCFCSPECATAHLMEENIDSSTKFERYHIINHIYSKIYDYKKNIKPAPNPFYMLDKYYGNLSIQEYRSLLRNERLFLVVDKPLTRVLPELHEDNDDFIINNKIIPSNSYQIKKKLQKKQQTKSNILNEKFGLTQ